MMEQSDYREMWPYESAFIEQPRMVPTSVFRTAGWMLVLVAKSGSRKQQVQEVLRNPILDMLAYDAMRHSNEISSK